jgi:serine/threonine-protein kinase RsbW
MSGPRTEADAAGEQPRMNPSEPFIEFRIPPDAEYLRIARLAAGDMGGRVGFSIDELDDVRLAVDELCSILIGAGGHVLALRMQIHGRTLMIEGRTPDPRAVIETSDLSEMLLRALVDSFTLTNQDREVCFEMRKQAREIA